MLQPLAAGFVAGVCVCVVRVRVYVFVCARACVCLFFATACCGLWGRCVCACACVCMCVCVCARACVSVCLTCNRLLRALGLVAAAGAVSFLVIESLSTISGPSEQVGTAAEQVSES